MHRFFLSPELISENEVGFPDDLAHQIVNVLRLREGDEVAVLDDRGNIYQVSLFFGPGKDQVGGQIIKRQPTGSEPEIKVSLFFGLSNRDKVEWILQKGTEIGISAFFPFVSSRTLVQSNTLSSKRVDRWERIIREAAEQSHRGRLPMLVNPRQYDQCLIGAVDNHDLGLIAWEEAEHSRTSLKSLIRNFEGKSIALFIGPEGGFSEKEVEEAIQKGIKCISLGKRILRMETAAIVFPALVLHELGAL